MLKGLKSTVHLLTRFAWIKWLLFSIAISARCVCFYHVVFQISSTLSYHCSVAKCQRKPGISTKTGGTTAMSAKDHFGLNEFRHSEPSHALLPASHLAWCVVSCQDEADAEQICKQFFWPCDISTVMKYGLYLMQLKFIPLGSLVRLKRASPWDMEAMTRQSGRPGTCSCSKSRRRQGLLFFGYSYGKLL